MASTNHEKISVVVGLALFLGFSLLSFFGDPWWTPRFSAVHPVVRGLILLTLGLLILRPPSLGAFAALPPPEKNAPRIVLGLVQAAVIFGILFVFRQATPTTGDAVELLQRIESIEDLPGFYLSGFNSPLSSWLCVVFHRWAHGFMGWSAELSLAVLSCACGAMAFFVLRDIMRMLWPEEYARQRFFLLLSYTSGCFAVFFGHIEFYAFLFLGILYFVRQSLGNLRGLSATWSAGVAIGVAACFHRLALVAVPAFGILILCRHPSWSNRRKEILKGLLAVGIPMLLGQHILDVSGVWGDGGGSFDLLLTLSPDDPRYQYSWLGTMHLGAMLGWLVLGSWAGVVLCLTGAFRVNWASAVKAPDIQFLGALALCVQAWAMLWNPDLGPAVDWDLFSLTGLAWLLVGLGIYSRLDMGDPGIRRFTLLALCTGSVQQIAWIWAHYQGG